ncbi:MAG: two-component system, chemotaxis family, protein-glutamate methylesterase/glutaminase [Acidobacteriota bacterium]|jgi:two-component system chemotaxis response regulator CheB|nr:two-component system, chemotaxis family, protein-glutamate methylesterase/glutaminase [Acidobacteriota bacterium]
MNSETLDDLHLIAIGASAGGVHTLSDLISYLPNDLPAAVLVVLHLAPHGRSVLPAILSRAGVLEAIHPQDGELLKAGRIYVAPPDHHMAVQDGRLRLSRSATENGHRPAIDVTFRTAALAYGTRCVGVVLTGNLDDGTAGLAAIKGCGGIAVVQDPREALYPSMPESAIAEVAVDYVLPVADMALVLQDLVRREPLDFVGDCGEKDGETTLLVGDWEGGAEVGQPTGLTCPECGGSLFETPGQGPDHFRCRTGHAYSPKSLLAKQTEALEGTLWAAMRALEESAALARRLEHRSRKFGNAHAQTRYERRALRAEAHAEQLRQVLASRDEEADPEASQAEPSRSEEAERFASPATAERASGG